MYFCSHFIIMSSKKEWFESWFDTSYYHTLYKHRDHKEAEVFMKNLVNYLNLSNNASLLDLACGKGRHAIYLNSLGFQVTGVDLSKNSIEKAKRHENETLKESFRAFVVIHSVIEKNPGPASGPQGLYRPKGGPGFQC